MVDAIEQILKEHEGGGDSSNANRHSRTDSNVTANRKAQQLNTNQQQFIMTGEKTTMNAQQEGLIVTENNEISYNRG